MNEQTQASIQVSFSFPVSFTHNALSSDNPALAEILENCLGADGRVRVYVDEGASAAHPDLPERIAAYAAEHFPRLAKWPCRVWPGGERVKDGWRYAQEMIDDLNTHRLCRQSILLAIGGGAFLDAAGFAAALVHRGVRIVRMPTTALAMGDSGVGVKNGVNLHGQKNFIGTFAPPAAVVNDLTFLHALPLDQNLDGVAEAFKVAIIRDQAMFSDLEENAHAIARGEMPVIEAVIRRSAEVHLRHIQSSGDPFEMGTARPLDFGHWVAHRLEAMSGYTMRHGQAVAIGVALDTWYGAKMDFISNADRDRILQAFQDCGLPTWSPLLDKTDSTGQLSILQGLQDFREHLGGDLCITLPHGIGKGIEVNTYDTTLLPEGIAFLRAGANA